MREPPVKAAFVFHGAMCGEAEGGATVTRDTAGTHTAVFRLVERNASPCQSVGVETAPFTVDRGSGLTLEGESAGDGPPIVLVHGLSATRRNVVQGSRALLKRGYRLITYDARGHGSSSPGASYEYPALVEDLEAVLAHLGIERAALVGSSMGAATAMAFALAHPERVPALVQITPAYTGYARTGDVDGDSWERMAAGLESGGVDGFVEVAQPEGLPEQWRAIAREATRQRMERHEHPEAVAQALREVPRSIAWKGLEPLEHLDVPVLIVGSRDEADRLHPLGVAEEYARRLPHAELVVEDKGSSPLAWQGARLSGAIADFLERVGYAPS
jgi:pimeloyl-ACP methyl ester carboxylesterase